MTQPSTENAADDNSLYMSNERDHNQEKDKTSSTKKYVTLFSSEINVFDVKKPKKIA